ncbi:Protocadherin gamma-C5 [Trichinella spiralis]|uniref:Protocadherin gamma-C5 n=1 Tax=Trichinella spiralis TaxID=6334 RepID=A0ABR3KL34_TRISP
MSRRYPRPSAFPYPQFHGGHIRQEAYMRNMEFNAGRPDGSSFQGFDYSYNDFHSRSFDTNLAIDSSNYLLHKPPEYHRYYQHHAQLRQQGRQNHQRVNYNRNELFNDSMFENPWEDLERQWNTKQLQYDSQSQKSESDDPCKKIWTEVQKIIESSQK